MISLLTALHDTLTALAKSVQVWSDWAVCLIQSQIVQQLSLTSSSIIPESKENLRPSRVKTRCVVRPRWATSRLWCRFEIVALRHPKSTALLTRGGVIPPEPSFLMTRYHWAITTHGKSCCYTLAQIVDEGMQIDGRHWMSSSSVVIYLIHWSKARQGRMREAGGRGGMVDRLCVYLYD